MNQSLAAKESKVRPGLPASAAPNPRFEKMYDGVRAFRKDAHPWWQLNELTFDSFLVRMTTRS